MSQGSSKAKVMLGVAAVLAAVSCVVILLVVAQQGGPDEQERVYRLKWLANVGFIGDLYADSYGLFLNEGLTVVVRPGGPEHDAIRGLQTEKAAFGVASADQVILALAQDADVVVIAQIYRKNPVQWIYRSDLLTITSPENLRGKRVGVTFGDNDETIMLALLRQSGIAEDALTLRGVRYDFLPFTTGNVDLFPVYRNTQGVELERQLKSAPVPVPVLFFNPDDEGVTFVANSIVTTSRMLKENRATVLSFLRAVLRGWSEALDKDKEDMAVRAMLRFEKAIASESQSKLEARLREQIAATRELVLPQREGILLGQIDVEAWTRTEEILMKQGILKLPVNHKVIDHLATDLLKEAMDGR